MAKSSLQWGWKVESPPAVCALPKRIVFFHESEDKSKFLPAPMSAVFSAWNSLCSLDHLPDLPFLPFHDLVKNKLSPNHQNFVNSSLSQLSIHNLDYELKKQPGVKDWNHSWNTIIFIVSVKPPSYCSLHLVSPHNSIDIEEKLFMTLLTLFYILPESKIILWPGNGLRSWLYYS